MENIETIQSDNVQIISTEDVIKNQVRNCIHDLMDAGKASKKQGWSMMIILDEVSMKFGKDMSSYAREYIIQQHMK